MQGMAAGKVERVSLQLEVLQEIRRQLSPYLGAEVAVSGSTVICDGATIDSLTLMDMVTELEDIFDVSIPMSAVAEIHTVDDLADTIIRLRAA